MMIIHLHQLRLVRDLVSFLTCLINIISLDEHDFNISIIISVFSTDEGGASLTFLNVPIQVFDDDINEADQVFIVELQVIDAVNTSLISLGQKASRCQIVDNDSKW